MRAASARVVLMLTALWVAAPLAQEDTARIYVTVVDKSGKPMRGLTAADFSVAENDVVKTVISVEPATEPLSVALLVDRFGQDANYGVITVRAAIAAMIKPLLASHPETEVSITTIDPAAVPQIAFTNTPMRFTNFINHVVTGVEQSVVLNGVEMAALSMREAKHRRRAIMAIFAGYKVDASSGDGTRLADVLRNSGASLWTLEGRSSFSSPAIAPIRDQALYMAVPISGGMASTVSAGAGIENQARRLSDALVAQYVVTYGVPSVSSNKRTVAVSRKDAKVAAPVWIARTP